MLTVNTGVPHYLGEPRWMPECRSASTFQLLFVQSRGDYNHRYLLIAGRGLPESSGLDTDFRLSWDESSADTPMNANKCSND